MLKGAKQMINQVQKTTLKPNVVDGAAPTTTRNLQDTWHLASRQKTITIVSCVEGDHSGNVESTMYQSASL